MRQSGRSAPASDKGDEIGTNGKCGGGGEESHSDAWRAPPPIYIIFGREDGGLEIGLTTFLGGKGEKGGFGEAGGVGS